MDDSSRCERNERRRKASFHMDADKKAAFLKQRRTHYAQRKNTVLHVLCPGEDVPAPTYNHVGPSAIDSVSGSLPTIIQPNDSLHPAQSDMTKTSYASTAPVPTRSTVPWTAHIDQTIYPCGKQTAGTNSKSVSTTGRSEVCSSILPHSPDCNYCQDKRFYHEPPGFCCSEGEISIAFPVMPAVLAHLFTSSDVESVNFRKYVRSYNNNLAFTTFAAKKDNELMKNKQGIYTFKVQGKIHHYLACFTGDTDQPTGLQFYFYDPEAELEERLGSSSRFCRDVMVKLMQIMSENPYAQFLRHVRELECVDAYKLYLVSNPRLDQRLYNEPACNEVSAIISIDEEGAFNPECHIQIYSRNAAPYRICHNFGCYDPLQYPMLFPHGEVGWHCGIEKLPPNRRKRGYRCRDPLLGTNAFAGDADELICQERLGIWSSKSFFGFCFWACSTGKRNRVGFRCFDFY